MRTTIFLIFLMLFSCHKNNEPLPTEVSFRIHNNTAFALENVNLYDIEIGKLKPGGVSKTYLTPEKDSPFLLFNADGTSFLIIVTPDSTNIRDEIYITSLWFGAYPEARWSRSPK